MRHRKLGVFFAQEDHTLSGKQIITVDELAMGAGVSPDQAVCAACQSQKGMPFSRKLAHPFFSQMHQLQESKNKEEAIARAAAPAKRLPGSKSKEQKWREAITNFTVLETGAEEAAGSEQALERAWALLELELVTGRTHQVGSLSRIHSSNPRR